MLQELCFGLAASTLLTTFGQFVSDYWFAYLMTILIILQAGMLFLTPLHAKVFLEDKDDGAMVEKRGFFARKTLKIRKDTTGVFDKIKRKIHDCKSPPVIKRRAHTIE